MVGVQNGRRRERGAMLCSGFFQLTRLEQRQKTQKLKPTVTCEVPGISLYTDMYVQRVELGVVKREASAGDSDRQINEPGAIIILPPYRISSVPCIPFLSSHWRLLFPCRPQEPAVTLPPSKCAFVGTVFLRVAPLLLFLHGQMTTYA